MTYALSSSTGSNTPYTLNGIAISTSGGLDIIAFDRAIKAQYLFYVEVKNTEQTGVFYTN
jgi:hypothetical protein